MGSKVTFNFSDLSRYKPAILFVTGLAAAYALYILQTHIREPESPSGSHTSLRRSNAIHRRYRPPRRGEGQQETESNEPQTQPTEIGGEGEREDLSDGFIENRELGSYVFTDPTGQVQEVILRLSTLPTAGQLQDSYGLNQAQADLHRNLIEMRYLDAFGNNPPPRAFLAEPVDMLAPRFRQLLSRWGISSESMHAYFARSSGHVGAQHQRDPRPAGDRAPRLEDSDTVVEGEAESPSRREQGPSARAAKSLLNLLYHIAEDQARREGYVHRGVTCNACGVMPIRGIRYRCSNCSDFDLCESCESMQIHPKTHLFYKVRVPAPFLANPRQAQPVWYPGKPTGLSHSIPSPLAKRLIKETGYESAELDAMWDQFKCLAATEWREDPNNMRMAIDRKTFNRCFAPVNSTRARPPQLIYDRIFMFYDVNGDGLIGFEEFVKGVACLNSKDKDERLRKIYRGYDIDGDGYVDRKDFLRIFRAYYALSKEMTEEMLQGLDDDEIDGVNAREVLAGSQPISSIFSAPILEDGRLAAGVGKEETAQGDEVIVDGGGVIRESGDDTIDRNQIVADAALRRAHLGTGEDDWRRRLQAIYVQSPRRRMEEIRNRWRQVIDQQEVVPTHTRGNAEGNGEEGAAGAVEGDEEEADEDHHSEYYEEGGDLEDLHDTWPPFWVTRQDVESVLGANGPPAVLVRDRETKWQILEAAKERRDEERRQRREQVRRQAIQERWRRRQFYVDEEEGAVAPEGYEEQNDDGLATNEDESSSLHDEINSTHGTQSRPPSPRSRSSSKVRFQEDMNETRSNPSTSSRSIPFAERWGGYEIPEAEKDVGREILYQVTQQGLNEMLDPLFKEKEDLALEVLATRGERRQYRHLFNKSFEAAGGKVNEDKNSGGPDEQGKGSTDEDRTKNDNPSGGEHTLLRPENVIPYPFPSLPSPRTSQSHSVESAENTESSSSVPPFDQSFLESLRLDAPDLFFEHETEPEVSTSGIKTNNEDLLSTITTATEEPQEHYDPTLPHHRPNSTNVTPNNNEQPISTTPNPAKKEEEEEYLDPTLPHHRSNTTSNPPAPTQHEEPSSSSATTIQKHPTAPPPPTQPSSTTKPKPNKQHPQIPSESRLSHLARLDEFEKEIKSRGGPGRLNFQEFHAVMTSPSGARLGFLGSWVEMATF